jgi:hypothetical protein
MRSRRSCAPGRFRRHGARAATALLSSLKRIWSAKNRVPHQTGWGTSGASLAKKKISAAGIPGIEVPTCEKTDCEVTAGQLRHDEVPLLHRVAEQWIELMHLARRTAPGIVVVILNIFR